MRRFKLYIYLRLFPKLPKWLVQAHARFTDRHYRRMVKQAIKYFTLNPQTNKVTIEHKEKIICFHRAT